MRTSAHFGAKKFGFFKIYDVSARTGRRQCGQGRGVNFSRFRADVFMDGPENKIMFLSRNLDQNMSKNRCF